MASVKFELKRDLPQVTQDEITRIEAISSGLRSTEEANFLTAIAPYRTNSVLTYSTDHLSTAQEPDSLTRSTDLILEAEGNTLPTSYEGFKKVLHSEI